MNRLALVFVLALAPLAAACGTTSDAAPPPATVKTQAATPDRHALCVQVFTRARACTDDYIPALVDTRARLDTPTGIAAQVAADRAGVIAQAKTEWATDSTDASIDSTCTRAEAAMSGVDASEEATAHDCLAKADCAAYTACIMPSFEKHLHR